jgi:hypothetical protein
VRDGNYLSGEARLVGIGSAMKSLARASMARSSSSTMTGQVRY